jgi:uncharacterized protein YqgQ
MRRLMSYLVVFATVVAAVAAAPAAHAANPNAAALRAIELRSRELGKLCQSGTLSREVNIGHCGPITQASNPNAAALRAIELRSRELGKLCQSGTLSREVYIGHCGPIEVRGQAIDQVATVRATPTTAGFDWADFGIGAGSVLGLVLLAGGVATRVHGRKGSVRPRPAP